MPFLFSVRPKKIINKSRVIQTRHEASCNSPESHPWSPERRDESALDAQSLEKDHEKSSGESSAGEHLKCNTKHI